MVHQAAVDMHARLDRIYFDDFTATMIFDDKIIVQVSDIGDMTNKDINNLVSAIKRPGGMIANPNAWVGGAPANIANPGSTAANVARRYLKLSAYYIRHQIRRSRDCIHVDITIANLKSLLCIRDVKDNH